MAETDVRAGPAVRVRTARTADNAQIAAIHHGHRATDAGRPAGLARAPRLGRRPHSARLRRTPSTCDRTREAAGSAIRFS